MAMASLSCTGLPVSSALPPSYSSPHVTESSNTPHLASFSSVSLSRHGRSPRLALRLSCGSSSSLAGSSLNLAFRQTERRQVGRTSSKVVSTRCESTSEGGTEEKVLRASEGGTEEKIPFGYTRKDVLLIGLGITALGVGLKYGLELFGVDSLRAGNVVQIVMVAGLTIGWISSYILRVSSKDMTYAKQLKDYENKVMEKRLEELPEAELENMLAQVEEERTRLQQRRDKRSS